MRILLIFLCLLAASCNNGADSHHRSYVISKSTETMEESEAAVEPLPEE